MLRDIARGKDAQLKALATIVETVDPDILLLTKVDYDAEQRTAQALREFLGYQHMLALAPNSMQRSDLDLDGDGKIGDRQVWTRYAGEGAMLLLSRYPIEVQFHLNDLLWRDVDGAQMPKREDGGAFPSLEAQKVQKLVGQGLWVAHIDIAQVTLALFQNQAPVFDGAEDMNGLRSRAQLGLLSAVMNRAYGAFPKERFVLLGNSNLDPDRGDGDRAAMAALLADPRLQDRVPRSARGDVATAFWDNPGPMRVSYVLPSHDWNVQETGVFWPKDGPLAKMAEQASRHRMVWMDIMRSP